MLIPTPPADEIVIIKIVLVKLRRRTVSTEITVLMVLVRRITRAAVPTIVLTRHRPIEVTIVLPVVPLILMMVRRGRPSVFMFETLISFGRHMITAG